MKVYLLKTVDAVGFVGEIKKVEDGFARNYLLPRRLAVEVTPANEATFLARNKKVEQKKEAVVVQTSQLAERIKGIKVSLKKKMHADGKLYGAVSAHEVVEALAREGVAISKSQVEFNKSIKTKGTFDITIRLTARLKPMMQINVLPE